MATARAKTKVKAKAANPQAALREYALAFPEAHEEFPWGERVVKVGKKIFVFLGRDEELDTTKEARGLVLRLTVKLPESGEMAIHLPGASPAGYGMGAKGWVTMQFTRKQAPPLPELFSFIDESYCAIAPKKLQKLRKPVAAAK